MWDTQEWRDEALSWAASCGAGARGEIDQRIRPWATALRIPTAQGIVWLKANSPGTASEIALVDAMASRATPHVLTPLAIDLDRCWLLLPDGGPTLRMALDRHTDLGEWERLLPKYAELQQSLEGVDVEGLEDHTPSVMPALFREQLSVLEVGPRAELEALLPRYDTWCEELAGSGIWSTVQHDDLHDGNVFANHLIFDWGDAVLAHPFASLLVTQRNIADRFSLAPGAPELARLRDCYLEAWTDGHTRVELEYFALLATRVGKVSRSRSWLRALSSGDPGEFAEAPAGWLEELLEVDVF